MAQKDWYRIARRKVLIDNHLDDVLPGYEKYDSAAIAEAGFEAGMIYARCHVGTCYWWTPVRGPSMPGCPSDN